MGGGLGRDGDDMRTSLSMVTGPTVEPVSLDEAKAHLRVDIEEDDWLIAMLIEAARMHVEQHLKRPLVTQTWELAADRFPAGRCWRVPLPPLQSVTSIKYTDDAGVESTVSSDDYVVDSAAEPGRIVLKDNVAWPSATLAAAGGVKVRFTAGYGLPVAVPMPIKHAILLLVGTLYENREDTLVAQGVTVMRLPFGVVALLMPYRVLRV